MNEKHFKDNLKTDNVAVDKVNVFPNIGANKHRLEVEKIDKIIADVTDGNFEKFETDEDVYNALQNTTAQDIRLILKACANTLGIDCAVEPLQKLNKPRMIALFFESFGVYPEKNPMIDDGQIEDNNDDDSIDEETLKVVFPNFNGAVELDFAKVAKDYFCDAVDTLADRDAWLIHEKGSDTIRIDFDKMVAEDDALADYDQALAKDVGTRTFKISNANVNGDGQIQIWFARA